MLHLQGVANPEVALVLLAEDGGHVLLRRHLGPGEVGRDGFGRHRLCVVVSQNLGHHQVGQDRNGPVGYRTR